MSLEATTNAIEDFLIDSISFKLQPGASYVTDRRSVTFHPQGSNVYKPVQGTKVIKVTMTGDQWLDPSTVQLQYTLVNENSTHPLYLLGGPHTCFRVDASGCCAGEPLWKTLTNTIEPMKCFII